MKKTHKAFTNFGKNNLVKVLLTLICTGYFLGCSKVTTQNETEELTIIIGAFKEELDLLKDNMENSEIIDTFHMSVIKGSLAGKKVVLSLSGMGKVNAAMTTTYLIRQFNPKRIIFTGIAGGLNPDLHPGDIVIGDTLVQHDLIYWLKDTIIPFETYNPTSGEAIPLYFEPDSILFKRAFQVSEKIIPDSINTNEGKRLPKIIRGTIVTGDAFIASSTKKDALIEMHGADAVEMEGAAIAQVCRHFGIPYLIIRSISDGADENAQNTLEEFYSTAAENSANLVMNLLREL